MIARPLPSYALFGFATLILAATSAVATGCAEVTSIDANESSSDAIRALTPDEIIGDINPGETRGPISHPGSPMYRALRLRVRAGQSYDAWVRSNDGDAVAFVANASWKSLGANDDASPATHDAHVAFTAPSNDPLYVIFRERDGEPATFSVSVTATNDAADAGPQDPDASNTLTTNGLPRAHAGVVNLVAEADELNENGALVTVTGRFTTLRDPEVLAANVVEHVGSCDVLGPARENTSPGYAGERVILSQRLDGPPSTSQLLVSAPQDGPPGTYSDRASFSDLDAVVRQGALFLGGDGTAGFYAPIVSIPALPRITAPASIVRGREVVLTTRGQASSALFIDSDAGVSVRCRTEGDGTQIRVPASLTTRFTSSQVWIYGEYRSERTEPGDQKLKVVVTRRTSRGIASVL